MHIKVHISVINDTSVCIRTRQIDCDEIGYGVCSCQTQHGGIARYEFEDIREIIIFLHKLNESIQLLW